MNTFRKITSWAAQATFQQRDLLREIFDLRDLFWISGLAAVGYGVAQIYSPAAWIVCGCVVFWMGVKR
jgi:hypothetical protein